MCQIQNGAHDLTQNGCQIHLFQLIVAYLDKDTLLTHEIFNMINEN